MVAAYHLIWTIYGAWLPNDPRGSNSTEIRSSVLEELGEIHFGRKKIQPSSAIIRKFYDAAKWKLKHDILRFNDDDVAQIADAFGNTMKTCRYTCYGCAIMPDHVHLVIRKHRDQAEEMIGFLQDESWKALIETGRWPADHPVWGGPGWKVYLDSIEDIERTIQYVNDNPIKAKQPAQSGPFVLEYNGWLPGVGARPRQA